MVDTRHAWLRALLDEVSASSASLMAIDGARGRLEIVAHEGFLHAPDLALPIGVGIAGLVAETGQACAVNNAQDDERFLAAEHDIERLLAVPITGPDGAVTGVVNLSDPADGADYTDAHIARVERYLSENPVSLA